MTEPQSGTSTSETGSHKEIMLRNISDARADAASELTRLTKLPTKIIPDVEKNFERKHRALNTAVKEERAWATKAHPDRPETWEKYEVAQAVTKEAVSESDLALAELDEIASQVYERRRGLHQAKAAEKECGAVLAVTENFVNNHDQIVTEVTAARAAFSLLERQRNLEDLSFLSEQLGGTIENTRREIELYNKYSIDLPSEAEYVKQRTTGERPITEELARAHYCVALRDQKDTLLIRDARMDFLGQLEEGARQRFKEEHGKEYKQARVRLEETESKIPVAPKGDTAIHETTRNLVTSVLGYFPLTPGTEPGGSGLLPALLALKEGEKVDLAGKIIEFRALLREIGGDDEETTEQQDQRLARLALEIFDPTNATDLPSRQTGLTDEELGMLRNGVNLQQLEDSRTILRTGNRELGIMNKILFNEYNQFLFKKQSVLGSDILQKYREKIMVILDKNPDFMRLPSVELSQKILEFLLGKANSLATISLEDEEDLAVPAFLRKRPPVVSI